MRIERSMATIRDHQKTAPVQTIPLAKALGISVYYVDWDDNMSGRIQRDADRGGDSGYAIYINKNHVPNRRRFTVAHEIAHYLLHRDLIGDGVYDDALYRSGLPRRVEFEANRMAADILMPWHLMEEASNLGITELDELAARFQVSKSAMAIRLGIPYDD